MMRYARYAMAIVFALLAVGFVALWVRSCYREDFGSWIVAGRPCYFDSLNGVVWIEVMPTEALMPEVHAEWISEKLDASDKTRSLGGRFGFDLTLHPSGNALTLPHWFLAASSLALAALFAFKRTWRYSLRTVLIATTVVAAVLGLAVWAV